MTCKEANERIYEYLDCELGKDIYSEIKIHLDLCRKCCNKFEFEQSLKKVIRDKSQTYKISETVRQRIVKQLTEVHGERSGIKQQTGESNGTKRHKVIQLFAKRPAYLIAAAVIPFLVSGLAVYFAFFRPTPPSPIIREVAECHDQHIHDMGVFDFVSPDRNGMSRKFNELRNFNFAVAVPEPNEYETRLLGCKDCYLAGRKSVHVELEKRMNMRFSLEIIDGSEMNINNLKKEFSGGRAYHFGRHKDYNVLLWKDGNTLYALTSEAQKKELIHVADETMQMRRFRDFQPFFPKEK
ncbi:MAG: hypothetical protein MRK02_05985 [Candidatus Scalindua sp.]|nr:hypothetical protein [Candidatus Scalindua sp.]